MVNERWLPVVGYKGIYEVSDRGQVRSITRQIKDSLGNTRTIRGKMLAQISDSHGYRVVSLCTNGKCRLFKVHRLVLLAFNPVEGADLLDTRHNDDNPSNNLLQNLQWGTRQDNMNDCVSRDRQAKGLNNGRAKLSVDDVHAIRTRHQLGESFIKLGRVFSVSETTVARICKGQLWSHV